MIAPRIRGRVYLQSFMDALITFSTFWAYLFVFILLQPGGSRSYTDNLGACLIYSLMALGAVVVQGTRTIHSQPQWWTPGWRESHKLSLSQVWWVALALCVGVVAIGDYSPSRIFLFSWLPLLYACLLLANRFLPRKIMETVYNGRRERTVFLGNMEATKALAGWRDYQEETGTEFIDYLPDFSISDMANLERLMRERNVSKVILMELPEVRFNLQHVTEICDRVGARLLLFSNLERVFRHQLVSSEEAGLLFFSLKEEPLDMAHNRLLKRFLDVVLVASIGVLIWPFLLIVWMGIRISCGGPAILREPRVGLKGEVFTIFKFRTKGMDGSVHPMGAWLCAKQFDELPQLWNVLRGNMSLVGPRPRLPEQKEEFARVMRNYYIRSMVKPGITGWAQVRGFRGRPHSEEEILRRVEADVYYLENWSLGFDLAILARTVRQGLRPRN